MNVAPTPDDLLDAAIGLARVGMAGTTRRPFVVGICGAQGSGKTTFARKLVDAARNAGIAAAALSLDDIYLRRDERLGLARTVHPLFATRGPPGTHDIALGLDTLAQLATGKAVPLPVFDKACDDRCPRGEWPLSPPDCELLVFEGWCVGALPQGDIELADPANALEAGEDGDGIWRRHANAALAGPYQDLFARIDRLILLAAPGFEVVRGWRTQQEQELRARTGDHATGIMDDAEIARFIAHYERITRHILREMPGRADLAATLDPARRITALRINAARTGAA